MENSADITNITIDIWQSIFDGFDIKTQLLMSASCRFFYNNLYVKDLSSLDYGDHSVTPTDDVLSQEKYKYLTALDANDNHEITDVSHLTNLRELYAENCGINQTGIKNLTKIEILHIPYREEITDVSHMTKLKVLDAEGSGITQEGIKGLNLVNLHASKCINITDVSYMTNLEELWACDECGVDQQSISKLNLRILGANNNNKINNVNHMTKLRELHAGKLSGIDQEGIIDTDLEILWSAKNMKISDLFHLTNLRELHVPYFSGIDPRTINSNKLQVINGFSSVQFQYIPTLKGNWKSPVKAYWIRIPDSPYANDSTNDGKRKREDDDSESDNAKRPKNN